MGKKRTQKKRGHSKKKTCSRNSFVNETNDQVLPSNALTHARTPGDPPLDVIKSIRIKKEPEDVGNAIRTLPSSSDEPMQECKHKTDNGDSEYDSDASTIPEAMDAAEGSFLSCDSDMPHFPDALGSMSAVVKMTPVTIKSEPLDYDGSIAQLSTAANISKQSCLRTDVQCTTAVIAQCTTAANIPKQNCLRTDVNIPSPDAVTTPLLDAVGSMAMNVTMTPVTIKSESLDYEESITQLSTAANISKQSCLRTDVQCTTAANIPKQNCLRTDVNIPSPDSVTTPLLDAVGSMAANVTTPPVTIKSEPLDYEKSIAQLSTAANISKQSCLRTDVNSLLPDSVTTPLPGALGSMEAVVTTTPITIKSEPMDYDESNINSHKSTETKIPKETCVFRDVNSSSAENCPRGTPNIVIKIEENDVELVEIVPASKSITNTSLNFGLMTNATNENSSHNFFRNLGTKDNPIVVEDDSPSVAIINSPLPDSDTHHLPDALESMAAAVTTPTPITIKSEAMDYDESNSQLSTDTKILKETCVFRDVNSLPAENCPRGTPNIFVKEEAIDVERVEIVPASKTIANASVNSGLVSEPTNENSFRNMGTKKEPIIVEDELPSVAIINSPSPDSDTPHLPGALGSMAADVATTPITIKTEPIDYDESSQRIINSEKLDSKSSPRKEQKPNDVYKSMSYESVGMCDPASEESLPGSAVKNSEGDTLSVTVKSAILNCSPEKFSEIKRNEIIKNKRPNFSTSLFKYAKMRRNVVKNCLDFLSKYQTQDDGFALFYSDKRKMEIEKYRPFNQESCSRTSEHAECGNSSLKKTSDIPDALAENFPFQKVHESSGGNILNMSETNVQEIPEPMETCSAKFNLPETVPSQTTDINFPINAQISTEQLKTILQQSNNSQHQVSASALSDSGTFPDRNFLTDSQTKALALHEKERTFSGPNSLTNCQQQELPTSDLRDTEIFPHRNSSTPEIQAMSLSDLRDTRTLKNRNSLTDSKIKTIPTSPLLDTGAFPERDSLINFQIQALITSARRDSETFLVRNPQINSQAFRDTGTFSDINSPIFSQIPVIPPALPDKVPLLENSQVHSFTGGNARTDSKVSMNVLQDIMQALIPNFKTPQGKTAKRKHSDATIESVKKQKITADYIQRSCDLRSQSNLAAHTESNLPISSSSAPSFVSTFPAPDQLRQQLPAHGHNIHLNPLFLGTKGNNVPIPSVCNPYSDNAFFVRGQLHHQYPSLATTNQNRFHNNVQLVGTERNNSSPASSSSSSNSPSYVTTPITRVQDRLCHQSFTVSENRSHTNQCLIPGGTNSTLRVSAPLDPRLTKVKAVAAPVSFQPRKGTEACLSRCNFRNVGRGFIKSEFATLVLQWNPSWMRTQKRTGTIAPICETYSIVEFIYQNELLYYNTYVCLHLLDIWLQMCTAQEQSLVREVHVTKEIKDTLVADQEWWKLTGSMVLRSTDVFPKRDDILLCRTRKVGGVFKEIFARVTNVLSRDCVPPKGESCKWSKIKFDFGIVEPLGTTANTKIEVQILYNVRLANFQNEALYSLNDTIKYLVLDPANQESGIDLVRCLPNTDMKVLRDRIINSLQCFSTRITLVDTSVPCDTVVLITQVAYALMKQKKLVVVCLKNEENFKMLATRLSPYDRVLAVRAKEMNLPDNMVSLTLDKRLENKAKVADIFQGCPITLTLYSALSLKDCKHEFAKRGVTFILDESDRCTEMQTVLPLMYAAKSLVLLGNPHCEVDNVSPDLKKYRYNISLFQRLFYRKAR